MSQSSLNQLVVLGSLPILVLIIFSPMLNGGTTHAAVLIIRLLILLSLGIYLGLSIVNRVLIIPRLHITTFVLTFLGVAAISTALSPYSNQSLQWLIVLIGYAVLLYVIAAWIGRGGWTQVVIMVVMMLGVALFEASWAIIEGAWYEQGRSRGTFFNPNFLAGYVAANATLLLGYLCDRFSKPDFWKPDLVRTAAVLALGVMITAVTMTGSRGAVLALIVGCSVVLGGRLGRKGVMLFTLAVALFLVIPNRVIERLQTEHLVNPIAYSRWQIWQNAVHEIKEHPVGVGLGLYQYVYPRMATPIDGYIARYGMVAQTAHNEYIQMAVELGPAAVAVFIGGVVLVIVASVRTLRLLTGPRRGMVLGVTGAFVVILVHAATDSVFHEPALAIALCLYAGCLLGMERLTTGEARNWTWTWPSRIASSIAVASVLTLSILIVLRIGLAWRVYEQGNVLLPKQAAAAVDHYRIAVALDPGKALYHSAMGAAYFRMFTRDGGLSDASKAVEELQTASALNPLDGRLHALMGEVYVRLAEAQPKGSEKARALLGAAVNSYGRAAELEPYHAFHTYDLALVFSALGHDSLAEDAMRRGVMLEPNFLRARTWLARHYLATGRREAAAHEYAEIRERRERYAGWNKEPFEAALLLADTEILSQALQAS